MMAGSGRPSVAGSSYWPRSATPRQTVFDRIAIVLNSNVLVQIRFTQAARKHRIGRASARQVMAHVTPTKMITERGNAGWLYVGQDERDRELEIVAVELQGDEEREAVLLVLHVMPTHLRGLDPHA